MRYIKRNNLEVNPTNAKEISKHFNLSAITSEFLVSRGHDLATVTNLLSDNTQDITEHYELANSDIAAERIEEAMMVGEKIAVFGDYDADGICGTSIIINAFKSFGYEDVTYYIPHRISEGYGLNKDAIDIIAEQGCTLIITVDCGISNVEEVDYARNNGIDVIVTDHHLPGDTIPNTIVVNPKLKEDKRQHSLCGAAVALKLMCVLFDEGIYYENCDLAAIATIADMVDLTYENRAIVKMGLARINEKANVNIAYLASECFKDKKQITAEDISYGIAPAINAAGRIDAADKCVDLFTGASPIPQETAAILAHDNYNRRKIEKETYNSALEKIKDIDLSNNKAIILYDKDWHQGVLGIAASKIKNKYHRPVLLFTKNGDSLVGSARSVDGINIHAAIDFCSEHVSHFGGHFMAAGLSLDPDKYEDFKEKFEESLAEYDREVFISRIEYDVIIDTKDINLDLIKELSKLEPFGKGNHSPVFMIEDITISDYSKIGEDKSHFRCKIGNGANKISAVAFSNGFLLDENIKYDAVVSLQKNEWNGRSSVQAMIYDIKINSSSLNNHLEKLEDNFMLSQVQGLYGENKKTHLKGNYEMLSIALDESAFSTAILALDKESVYTIQSEQGEKFNDIDIRFIGLEDKKISNNTLVIAPDFETINFIGYDKIFIISKFDLTNTFNSLRTQGKVYIISDKTNRVHQYSLTLTRLRQLYMLYKKAVLNNNSISFISGNQSVKLWEARAALRIFKEAELADYSIREKRFMLTDKKKTDITQSKTFISMQAGE